MIYINEWLPNPIGNDNCKTNCGWNVEYVELANKGSSTVDLDGWAFWTGGKSKKVFLGGRIAPGGYLVFTKAETKLSLKNNNGGLWLYGPDGALVDHAAFTGAAPVRKSFSRIGYGAADVQYFAFVDPTPGAANNTIDNGVTVRRYPLGVPLDAPLGAFQFLGLLLAAATMLAVAWAYIVYKNENLSQLIFGGDAGVW